jgi:hypothetical protein
MEAVAAEVEATAVVGVVVVAMAALAPDLVRCTK